MTELRPAHRRQLLLYAFIWHSIHGQWPESAAVQRLDGTRLPLDIDPEEAAALVTDLLGRRDEFNSAADGSIWPLASPSSEACEHCPYRAACPPFFESVSSEWEWYRRSVVGEIIDASDAEEPGWLLLKIHAGDLLGTPDSARVLSVPTGLELEVGEIVAIVDGLPTRTPNEIRLAWDSCVFSWTNQEVVV